MVLWLGPAPPWKKRAKAPATSAVVGIECGLTREPYEQRCPSHVIYSTADNARTTLDPTSAASRRSRGRHLISDPR